MARCSARVRSARDDLGVFNKIFARTDAQGGQVGRPLIMLLSEGQMSDYKGAALMLPALPKPVELLGDKGYDADWFRQAPTASATKSRICSAGSRTGHVCIPATTDALTHSCLPYASPPSLSSGYNQ